MNNNAAFVQNLRNLGANREKMSGLFDLLHASRPQGAIGLPGLEIELPQDPADLKRNQVGEKFEDLQKTPVGNKSGGEFEEEDDVEVDKLTISDVGPDDQPTSRQNLKVPDIYDMEDFVPNADKLKGAD
jgi:hypothetical protein